MIWCHPVKMCSLEVIWCVTVVSGHNGSDPRLWSSSLHHGIYSNISSNSRNLGLNLKGANYNINSSSKCRIHELSLGVSHDRSKLAWKSTIKCDLTLSIRQEDFVSHCHLA